MTASQADRALGVYLRSLREAAGLDPAVLARRLSLSTAQLLQLEEGGHSLFYNPGIRMQVARKLITHLGGDASFLEGAPAADLPPPMSVLARAQDVAAPPAVVSPDPPPQVPAKEPRSQRPVLVGGLLLSALLFVLAFFAGRPVPPVATGPAGGPSSPPAPVAQAAAAAEPQAAEPQAAAPAREAPAAPAAEPAPEPAQGLSMACQPPLDDATVIRPPQATKPGDMVYLVSRVEQVVCVTDGNGQQQAQAFKAGQGLSFYGPPPWQLESSRWGQTQLFFQGWKVKLPAGAPEVIRLVERTELSQRSESR